MVHLKREKVPFNSRIRSELYEQFEKCREVTGLPKTKLIQLAIGDLVYKIMQKLPESEHAEHVVRQDHESLTDIFIEGFIQGHYNSGKLGFYLDVDLPTSKNNEEN